MSDATTTPTPTGGPRVAKAIRDMFGDFLQSSPSPRDTISVDEALQGKIIGIYFSAHWCGPCRAFTPRLIQVYCSLLNAGKQFEVVFASSDRDRSEYESYFGQMPWLALPFGDPRKLKLNKRFQVQGIPTLVLVGADGRLITKDAREAIVEDIEGLGFPWASKPFFETLGQTVINSAGDDVPVSSFKGKYLGIYFSASWCPPCRNFKPTLTQLYHNVNARHKATNISGFEIILADSDQEITEYKKELEGIPWLCLPFMDDRELRLSQSLGITGLPCLVILDPEGKLISKNGRALVLADPEGLQFPWYPPLVAELDAITAPLLNDKACCILFLPHLERAVQLEMQAVLKEVAARYQQKNGVFENSLSFLYALGDPVVQRVKDFAKIDGSAPTSADATQPSSIPSSSPLSSSTTASSTTTPTPLLIILDLNESVKYVFKESALTVDNVQQWVNDFEEGTLPQITLKQAYDSLQSL